MHKGKFQIIIVDDDVDDQFFIKEAIRNRSQNVDLFSVYNGLELLQWMAGSGSENRVETQTPDLIILDLNMPIMDGITALTKIKQMDGCRDIPVYILTTSKEEKDKQICSHLGARRFFSKPSEFAPLQAAIDTILGDLKDKNQPVNV